MKPQLICLLFVLLTSCQLLPKETKVTVEDAADQSQYSAALNKNIYYPLEAYEQQIEGEVRVEIILNSQGWAVGTNVVQSSGNIYLDTAAIRTVLATKFPGSKDQPEPVKFNSPFRSRIS